MTRRGFTLIETLACVALMGIVARAGVTATTSLMTALRVGASTRTLAQAMRETRARAMAEGQPLDVTFDAATGRWRIELIDGTVRRTTWLASPVRFVGLPASARIRFGSTGTAENGTIALGVTAPVMRIVVNQRGRVRLG